ncbi:MAG: laccase domain-containing protein [Polaromonas sp.]|nr:laccase domain-containing protein [Polaromonas sp.]
MHPDWLIPDWPAPIGVKAVFTTRGGGVSDVPWDSMNLGTHVGDVPEHVAANRALLQQSCGTRAVFLNQVHGSRVLRLDAGRPDGQQADACVTTLPKLACTIMVADCLPVLLAAEDGSVVAAAHAGWRGLAGLGKNGDGKDNGDGGGVLEAVFSAFSAFSAFEASFMPPAQQERASPAIKIIACRTMAWLGPCIGPSAFEVGSEVKAAFEITQAGAAQCFVANGAGKYLADLAGLARLRLQALGITQIYGNDSSPAWCTVANPSRFFSHRRDAGSSGNGFNTTGRMAACIWRD